MTNSAYAMEVDLCIVFRAIEPRFVTESCTL